MSRCAMLPTGVLPNFVAEISPHARQTPRGKSPISARWIPRTSEGSTNWQRSRRADCLSTIRLYDVHGCSEASLFFDETSSPNRTLGADCLGDRCHMRCDV